MQRPTPAQGVKQRNRSKASRRRVRGNPAYRTISILRRAYAFDLPEQPSEAI